MRDGGRLLAMVAALIGVLLVGYAAAQQQQMSPAEIACRQRAAALNDELITANGNAALLNDAANRLRGAIIDIIEADEESLAGRIEAARVLIGYEPEE